MATEYPAKRREDIQPFLFPCGKCRQYIFHALYEQPTGFTLKLAFVKSPLWSSGTGYLICCEKCDVVNGHLQPADVKKLAANILPRSIWSAYPDVQRLYQPGAYETIRPQLVGEPPDPQLTPLIDQWMTSYRLET